MFEHLSQGYFSCNSSTQQINKMMQKNMHSWNQLSQLRLTFSSCANGFQHESIMITPSPLYKGVNFIVDESY